MAMMAKGTAKAKIEQAKATITKAGEAKNQLKAKLEQRMQAAQDRPDDPENEAVPCLAASHR